MRALQRAARRGALSRGHRAILQPRAQHRRSKHCILEDVVLSPDKTVVVLRTLGRSASGVAQFIEVGIDPNSLAAAYCDAALSIKAGKQIRLRGN
jgi:hypothetical protein